MNEYDIAAAFQAIEEELIASMIRNMDRHRAEETKEGYEWSCAGRTAESPGKIQTGEPEKVYEAV